jgi:pSer/pThr/pTyr-binding forkhead associated (FHA) protein
MSSGRGPQAVLVALTPEAKDAVGGTVMKISRFPFRVGREARGLPRAAPRTLVDRRKPGSQPTNELYLLESAEPFQVSREHFQIQHNGTRYVLVDRQSSCGTIVEGTVVGGQHQGGAAQLDDGDVIIVGTSKSPYVFKFRIR